MRAANSSIHTGNQSAWTGSTPEAVAERTTWKAMSAQGVVHPGTEPSNALSHRLLTCRNEAVTPYIPDLWYKDLLESGLLACYPTIPNSLVYGFEAGIPCIEQTFTPPNHPSLSTHAEVFAEMVDLEFTKGRYLGPFSWEQVESELGPFQTSPISIIPKPGRANKFRIIQNLLHPRSGPTLSINAAISVEAFPCAWGTFRAICALIASLPPGTKAVV
ncbi:hypothetical protein APHAL10511_007506 [Amanita phalloides]|nr:hypothetical protein APHAL10511_007506 [Amanita phalloides]